MAHTTEMEYLRRLRGTARGKVTRKCQLLNEQVRQGKPSNIIEIYYEEVKEAFTELERRHETLVNRICEGEEKDEEFQVKLDEEDQYIAQVEIMKTEAYDQLLALRKRESDIREQVVRVKIKPLEPPRYDGDIRQYQTFRSNYNKIMTDNYGKSAFALYQCLSGEALSLVHGVEDDFDEMFRRLDQRYADPIKLTDCVIDQLKKLKPVPEGNTVKFVETVEVVEKCWTDNYAKK
ncbi:hypothetical protein Pmani_017044 [Petrolisthes manimaculis]|uniref:Uncharacterized protein n=1 Tax=Petrolisthes manimaculis TaxID=1843537 RepID=A0AAE1U9W2_9EUCA|nr:hypothetical protein Pmani_017044 [Petrolisthes manimaculis]